MRKPRTGAGIAASHRPASQGLASLTSTALRVGMVLARALPPQVVIGVAALVGRLSGHLSPSRGVVERNLKEIQVRFHLPPAKDGACRPGGGGREVVRPADVFASYGRYWGEFLVFSTQPEWFDHRLRRIEGEEHLRRAAAWGPVCALTGHLGNWDLCARFTRRLLPEMVVVAERLEPAPLYRLFCDVRERDGGRVLAADAAGPSLFRLWRSGGHAGLVVDRVFGRGQRTIPFLTGRRALPSSGVDLARRAGATLVPVFLVREMNGYVLRAHPPLSSDGDPLFGFAQALEREIARHPEQWCLLYPATEQAGPELAGVVPDETEPVASTHGPVPATTEQTPVSEACA